MADVRSMLRAERASRRITHPNASYTSDAKLLCNLCEVLVKSEAAWQGHLHSTGHTLRLSRVQDAAATRGTETTSKKRKASSLDSPAVEDRKKAKSAAPTPEQETVTDHTNVAEAVDVPLTNEGGFRSPGGPAEALHPVQPTNDVDEAELAAFERELAQIEASQPVTALTAEATISAAPMTAEEIAAQAREEQSSQRGRRDAEIEAEREDAARLLEDEFEEMEGLEERVRKLRERREALRKGSLEAGDVVELATTVEDGAATNGTAIPDLDEEDDEEEDQDFDAWGFGGS